MKLSQMTTDQAADTLMQIAQPVSNIMHDKTMMGALEKLAKSNTENPLKYIADNLGTVTVALLKTRRADVYDIISALSGKTVQEIAAQNFMVTLADVKDCMDGDLVNFFVSSK